MSLLAKRPRVDHHATATRLRAQPGVWLPVGEYRSSSSADSTFRYIRAAFQHSAHRRPSPYAPAGSFEARMNLTQDGVQVTARYIGDTKGGTP